MTKTTLYLRVASALLVIHAVLHTVGGVFGQPPPGPGAAAFEAMKSNSFPVMGNLRTYAEFYRGLGLGITVWLLSESVVVWLLGSLARSDARRLRPILLTFLVAYACMSVVSYRYFFFGPVVAELLIALCLGMAAFEAGAQRTPVSA